MRLRHHSLLAGFVVAMALLWLVERLNQQNTGERRETERWALRAREVQTGLNGRIWAKSAIDAGGMYFFSLPAAGPPK